MKSLAELHRTKYGHALEGGTSEDCRHAACVQRRLQAGPMPPEPLQPALHRRLLRPREEQIS